MNLSMIVRSKFIIILLLSSVLVVRPQTWTGTFAWDNQCRSRSCCCYSGTLTVTRSGSNLVFTSGTRGCSMSTASTTFTQPRGYSFSATGVRGAPITYMLSSDSNTMTVRNEANSQCTGTARRTSAGSTVTFSIKLAMALFTLLLLFLL